MRGLPPFWTVSGGAGVLGIVGGLVMLLIGVPLLFVDVSNDPVPLTAGRSVEVPVGAVEAQPVVVYGSAVDDLGSLRDGMQCVVTSEGGRERGPLYQLSQPPVLVDGVERVALVSRPKVFRGDSVRCDGPLAVEAGPLYVGVGEGDLRLAGILSLAFGVFALLTGVVFLVVALGLRASARRA